MHQARSFHHYHIVHINIIFFQIAFCICVLEGDMTEYLNDQILQSRIEVDYFKQVKHSLLLFVCFQR